MKSVVAKAASGQRAALKCLYDENRQHAWFLAKHLLQNDEKAIAAVTAAFEQVLDRAALEALSDDTFKGALEQAVAAHCRKQIPKALRLPQDRRFDLRDFSCASDGSDTDKIFSAFSDLQRWIFVLHAAGLNEEDICRATKLDRRTLQDALTAEQHNIAGLLPDTSYETVVKAFAASENSTAVPAALDNSVQPALTPKISEKEKKDKTLKLWTLIITIAVCVVLAALAGVIAWDIASGNSTSSDSNPSDVTTTTNAAMASVGTSTSVTATHFADIDIKDHGVITVALDSTIAPETVFNFKKLADNGFYDGLTFHRIMEGFMMQGGDPLGDGTGGSDENITGEFASNGIENPLSHVRGAISMARSNDPNSASSQFFIVHEDSTFLDGNYAAFGYVLEGMDIVDAICTAAEPTDGNGTIPAEQQPIINSITVRSAE